MSMSDLSAMLTDLEQYGRSILETAREIRELFSAKDEPESNSKEQDERKTADTHQAHPAITLDDVRREMTGRIARGYTAQCRELLKKYGAMKLSDVKETDYEELLQETQMIGYEEVETEDVW